VPSLNCTRAIFIRGQARVSVATGASNRRMLKKRRQRDQEYKIGIRD
jgi:hypothetical protein